MLSAFASSAAQYYGNSVRPPALPTRCACRWSSRTRVVSFCTRHWRLNFSAASAADRYGEWLLEQPRSFVLTLSSRQSLPLNNKIATSELGLICNQKDKSKTVGAILIPFDGTFENHNDAIPVLNQEDANQYDRSDLLQNWKKECIFLESTDDVGEGVGLLEKGVGMHPA